MPTSSPEQTLEQIRVYLLDAFPTVTVAHPAAAKIGTVMIKVAQGRTTRVIEIAETFLDGDTAFPAPLDALRKWDLIGKLKSVESGSIVRVTTSGLREV